MKLTDVLLIGVDGGATEVKAHAVACDNLEKPSSFELRPESASRVYARVAEFNPLPVAEQLAQRDAGDVRLSENEVARGHLWVEAAVQAIVEVAQACDARRVLAGVGMPGLKTPDGRGISVINNGPRIPDYLEALERGLAAAGIELAAPVAELGSDADYCGLGEQYASEGLFRDVENAYYVGGGTGLADALKLRGRLVSFDQAASWIQKSWQIPSALGPTFEKLISAKSLNRVYADLCGGTVARRHEAANESEPEARARADGGVTRETLACASGSESITTQYPEVAATAGQPIAVAWMDTAALVLAELIFERLWTIKNGRTDAPHRGEAYEKLVPEHEYRGLPLDRVVIGQRVGQIYGDADYYAVFRDKLDGCLAALIGTSNDAEMAEAYLSRSAGPPSPARLKSGLIQPSKLRAAPALGAAVAAVRTLLLSHIN